LTLPQDLILLF
jgi:decaprenyl-diphosphate synthase subunit 2